ncbi:MAG: outer membrane lipoprotein-sorting protein, partial [Verrucomicrobia bacterium]|nr:outer membrane lipoprotein-sorting protein [Verrucomicrobiota bacterium]
TDPVYARVVSWVDNETDGIVMAQAFNEKRKRVKEFEVQSFKKVDGVWQLKRMTIYNNLTDSRTTLEIDLEV